MLTSANINFSIQFEQRATPIQLSAFSWVGHLEEGLLALPVSRWVHVGGWDFTNDVEALGEESG